MSETDKKSQKYFAVSRAILQVIERDGMGSLTHSVVARESKVSRAWIYEYMGKEKEDLMAIASDTFSEYFQKNSIVKGIDKLDDLLKFLKVSQDVALEKNMSEPVIIKFYYRFRGTNTRIGSSIKKYEKNWLENMAGNIQLSLNIDSQEALLLARTLLMMRLGFYHRIATASSPAKEMAEAQVALETAYKQLLKKR